MNATANDIMAMNARYRALTLARSIPMLQSISNETIPLIANGASITRNIALKNVGLTRRLFIAITCNIRQSAGETHTRTPFGPANLLSNVTMADFNNYQRINTTGWHLHSIASVKNRAPFGAAFTTDTPTGQGSNFNVINAPPVVTTVQTVRMIYEVPFAYTDNDLTGAILTNVINANAYLTLTINPNITVASTGSMVTSVYRSSTAALAIVENFQIEVYQDYLDQLPMDPTNGTMLLPGYDLSQLYGLYNTQITGLSPNADNAVTYTNYRSFLSTVCVYDNNGALNAGTDIGRFKLQAANMTNIFDLPPQMVKLRERSKNMVDMPVGTYYFDHRDKPIDTKVNGNMQLLVNPSNVAGAGSQVLIGFEYIALQNQVAQAGSVLQ